MPFPAQARTFALLAALCLLAAATHARDREEPVTMSAETKQSLETIKARILAVLLETVPPAERARDVLKSQQPDGTWKDIDYKSKDPARWAPTEHLARTRLLALAARHPESPLHRDPAVTAAARKGFDAWLERDPQSSNWWFNQIGAPKSVYEIHLLLEEHLDEKARTKSFEIQTRAKLGMTGANLVWVANVTLARGCLSSDAEIARAAVDAIAKEIRVSASEGVQADFSFHQHGAQFYNGGYGLAYAADCARIAFLTEGTTFAFPAEKVALLSRYMLDGEQWMTRGPTFDYSAIGREIVRPGHSAKGLIQACKHLAALNTPDKSAFLAFSERLQGKPPEQSAPPSGNRLFWRSDYMTHQRKDWYASVRAASNRMVGTELINGENRLGAHLFEGVTYLLRTGLEYRDIFPVWDWASLPGITADHAQSPEIPYRASSTQSFAGGMSDGRCGGFGLVLKNGVLSARKSWFFFDDVFACLGAGITQSKGEGEVRTTLNQCLANGDVTCGDAAGAKPLDGAERVLKGPAWVYHDGVAYVLPQAGALTVRSGEQSGDWKRISSSQSGETVMRKVFLLFLSHGKEPKDAGYAYFVAPGLDATAAERFAAKPSLEILANTAACQAVRHVNQPLIQAVFFS